MLNFLKSRKCKAVLWVLALLIGLMLYAVFVGGYTISSVSVFNAVAAPFQRMSNAISQHVEYGLDLYRNAEDYYEENRALREEINLLHTELADYEAIYRAKQGQVLRRTLFSAAHPVGEQRA